MNIKNHLILAICTRLESSLFSIKAINPKSVAHESKRRKIFVFFYIPRKKELTIDKKIFTKKKKNNKTLKYNKDSKFSVVLSIECDGSFVEEKKNFKEQFNVRQ